MCAEENRLHEQECALNVAFTEVALIFRCTNPYSFHDKSNLFPLPSMIAFAAADTFGVRYSDVVECPLIKDRFPLLPETMFNSYKVAEELKVSLFQYFLKMNRCVLLSFFSLATR